MKNIFPVNWQKFRNFKPETDDAILTATYAKAGTTWHQELVDMILYKGDLRRDEHHIAKRAPFLEHCGSTNCFGSFSADRNWDHASLIKLRIKGQKAINILT